MTIKTYLEKAKSADAQMIPQGHDMLWSESVAECTDIWENDAVKGYVLKALRDAKLRNSTIDKVLMCLHWAFDEMTVDEAKAYYYD